jgi:hypothetical protein
MYNNSPFILDVSAYMLSRDLTLQPLLRYYNCARMLSRVCFKPPLNSFTTNHYFRERRRKSSSEREREREKREFMQYATQLLSLNLFCFCFCRLKNVFPLCRQTEPKQRPLCWPAIPRLSKNPIFFFVSFFTFFRFLFAFCLDRLLPCSNAVKN